ncbi:hypothetical protein COTS27_01006 [Spirochaetota bacterium]|nr:hypothetical protein COTS27_01006 [Spirochaetota bacterium]
MKSSRKANFNGFRCIVLGVVMLATIGLIGCGTRTETFSVHEDLATLIEASNPGIENLVVVEDKERRRLVISGFTNSSAGAAPSWTLDINQESGFTTEPTNITATAAQLISPHIDTSATLMVMTETDDAPVVYEVESRISGAPIDTWLTEDTFASYVVADFASVSATVTLAMSNNTFSLAGLTNAYNGQGSITVTNLPAGFVSEPDSILVNDPDNVVIGETNIVFSASSLRVSEQENPDNRRVYAVSEATLAQNQFLQVLNGIRSGNAGLALVQDQTDATLTSLLVSGLTNTVSGDLISQTITIPQNAGFTSDPTSFTVAATDHISPYDFTNRIAITFSGAEEPVMFTVKTRISGAPISEWITSYVTAIFSSQRAATTVATNDNGGSMLVFEGLTNGMGGMGIEGSITLADLPRGFRSIFTSPVMLDDPDDAATGAATIDLSAQPPLVIYELGDAARRVSYALPDIALAELTAFTPGIHIEIRDQSSSPLSDLIIEFTDQTDSAGNTLIRVTGLTNQTGDNDYDFVITSSTLFASSVTPAITISEPAGFSPGEGTLNASTFTVTPMGGSAVTYALEAPVFRGWSVSGWFTMGGYATYLTGGSFAMQTATIGFNSGNKLISMTGALTNVRNGEVALEFSLPDGYSVTGIADLRDPDDLGIAAINNGNMGSITILETDYPANSESYRVEITLVPYMSPLRAEHISATFGGSTVTGDPATSDITIDPRLIVTITGFTNFTGTSGDGSVTITPPTTPPNTSPDYEVSPSPLPFSNPEGFERTNIELSVDVTNSGVVVPHTILVSFSDALLLEVTANIENSPVRVASGDVITLTNACEYLTVAASTVFLDGTSMGDTVSSNTPFPRYRYYDRRIHVPAETSTNYRLVKTLTLNNSSGNALKEDFVVNVEFPPCDTLAAAGITTGTGVDAANAYELSTPIQLELVSHLIYRSNSEFGNKFYKLTADVDLGEANMPWSDTGWAGFQSLGQYGFPFRGSFDCGTNVVSNLFINKARVNLFSGVNAGVRFSIPANLLAAQNNSIQYISYFNDVGLFGSVAGANASPVEIKNCELVNVNVTGATNVGALVGRAVSLDNDDTNTVILDSRVTTGTVTGVNDVGGLVGGIYDATVMGTVPDPPNDRSYSAATVTGQRQVGGLVGHNHEGIITNSYSAATVSGQTNVGGLVGVVLRNAIVENSHTKAAASIEGQLNVGGLIGLNYPSLSIYQPRYGDGPLYFHRVVLPNRGTAARINDSYVEAGAGTVTGAYAVGGLVGASVAAIITNSYVGERPVNGTNDVGGLIGYSFFSVFSNSRAEAVVTGTDRVGGLVGQHTTGYVNVPSGFASTNYDVSMIDSVSVNSHATGAVTGVNDVGGLVGLMQSSPFFPSSATGESITVLQGALGQESSGSLIYLSNTWATGAVSGANRVGGLIGKISRYAAVTSSYATGDVTATGDYVGGLVGHYYTLYVRKSKYDIVLDSYASGNVTGNNNVGGVVGYSHYGNISNVYATGNVEGGDNVGGVLGHSASSHITNAYHRTGSVSGRTAVGGITGRNVISYYAPDPFYRNLKDLNALVSNAYATGAVSGMDSVGGLVGANSEGNIVNSYWDTATTGQSESAGSGAVGGRPTADMTNATAPGAADTDVYFNWNAAIWSFSGSAYPTLQPVVCSVRQTTPTADCP